MARQPEPAAPSGFMMPGFAGMAVLRAPSVQVRIRMLREQFRRLQQQRDWDRYLRDFPGGFTDVGRPLL